MKRDVAGGLPQALPQPIVGEQALDLAGNRLRVPGRDDERALAVGQRVGRDAHARRHNRQSRRHGLDERHAEPLVETRRDHDVGLAIELDEVEACEARDDGDARAHDGSEAGQNGIRGCQRSGADQPHVGMAMSDSR